MLHGTRRERPALWLCSVVLLLLALYPHPAESQAIESGPSSQEKALEAAIDSKVYVELKSGREYTRAMLLLLKHDPKTKRVISLRIRESERGRLLTLNLKAVWQVALDGKPIYQSPPEKGKNGRPAKVSKAEARAKRDAEARTKWLARLEARGLKPWKDLTKEEHQASLDKHKAMVEKVQTAFPGMVVYETEQFLVCSNIPPDQVVPYVAHLDAMFDMMCQMYRIRLGTPVWRGKALVMAFVERQQFQQFEAAFLKVAAPQSVYGLCHSFGNGDVIIACFRGDRRAEFAQMLVHETSHGFIHRYKTSVRLPSWVNEGMAEWIGSALVPESMSVKNKQQAAFERLKQTGRVGADFFTKSHLDNWQYGVASSLNDFLIKKDKQAYVDFIEGMKEGEDCEACFQRCYRANFEELLAAYGRAIGIPGLQK